jgi:CMP-N-acetylneuraminic acid synthetase
MSEFLALIPARMASQRLAKKNLRELGGVRLISRAIRKCKSAGVFDEVWVNSEHPDFGNIAAAEGVHFHQRPEELGNNQATSEQYIAEFLKKHECDWVVQVHSIAPLLTVSGIQKFVEYTKHSNADVVLSFEPIQIECSLGGVPINFKFSEKTNSQELQPIQRISWSITAWRRSSFLSAVARGECATYSGKVDYYPVSPLASHVIKTEQDLKIAEALLPLVED